MDMALTLRVMIY